MLVTLLVSNFETSITSRFLHPLNILDKSSAFDVSNPETSKDVKDVQSFAKIEKVLTFGVLNFVTSKVFNEGQS